MFNQKLCTPLRANQLECPGFRNPVIFRPISDLVCNFQTDPSTLFKIIAIYDVFVCTDIGYFFDQYSLTMGVVFLVKVYECVHKRIFLEYV